MSGLASRGIGVRCVVVADDDNLDIAAEHGFETIEMPNRLGAKVNAGFEHGQDADYLAFVGSDDWLHPDLFNTLPTTAITTGRGITLVDLDRGRLRRVIAKGRYGTIPWLIPRKLLEPCRFRPFGDHLERGLDYALWRHLRKAEWVYHDPHDHLRVDFKTENNMTSYAATTHTLGVGAEVSAWPVLRKWYPADLVELAEHREYARA